jgi:hypothetical protein
VDADQRSAVLSIDPQALETIRELEDGFLIDGFEASPVAEAP